jgi:hypothetical protein
MSPMKSLIRELERTALHMDDQTRLTTIVTHGNVSLQLNGADRERVLRIVEELRQRERPTVRVRPAATRS